jgi:hypothetical protein
MGGAGRPAATCIVVLGHRLLGSPAAPDRRSTAIRLLRGPTTQSPVLACRAQDGTGIDGAVAHPAGLIDCGGLEPKQRQQQVEWAHTLLRERLLAPLATPAARGIVEDAEANVRNGFWAADDAARFIVGGSTISRGPELGVGVSVTERGQVAQQVRCAPGVVGVDQVQVAGVAIADDGGGEAGQDLS